LQVSIRVVLTLLLSVPLKGLALRQSNFGFTLCLYDRSIGHSGHTGIGSFCLSRGAILGDILEA
jgi:hypothetical protein